MSLRENVEQIIGLSGAFRPGFQALGSNSTCVTVNRASTQASIAGSIDLDGALKTKYPNAARWDYAIFQYPSRRPVAENVFVHWIEVHPASGENCVSEVVNKATWLKGWLCTDGKSLFPLDRVFIWVATGHVSPFPPSSPQARRLASAGVKLAGRRYTISA